jgi:sigma-B regulation protein RsbU (phosphoserine phosphatase)
VTMADLEEVLWTGETTPTLAGVRDLRRSFADRIAQLPLAREIGEDLSVALVEIGVNVAAHADGATRLVIELKRHDAEWTLTVADDGTPLLHDATSLRDRGLRHPDPLQESGRGLYIVASRFPQNLYVPRHWRSRASNEDVNRFMVRAVPVDAGRTSRILVVDDDPVQRMAIELYLRGDYTVIACATAAEAELEAKLQTPDLIISDIHMPDDDGLAFRDRLAQETELGLVPFLFLTSDRSPGALAAANESGIDDLLYKPLDKRRLRGVLDRVLRRQQQLKMLRRHEQTAGASLRFPSQTLPDRVERYSLAARRISADQSIDVNLGGGDLIWHRHTADAFQLLMCDAMGHGVGAWPLAMANLGFVRGAALGMGSEIGPGEFIANLSDLLSEEGMLDGAALTVVGCWLGPDGAVSLANAGQPHPFLVGADGTREIDVEGGLIGLLPGQKYETRQVMLRPGDRLVLVTDGFIEDADPDVARLAEQALVADLGDLAGRPPAVIAEGLLRAHLMRSGGRTADDSMVCVIGFD